MRVAAPSLVADKNGQSFVAFSVEVSFGGDWETDFVGCVYRGSEAIFVRRGDGYRPAKFLLGSKAEPVPGVCEPAPARS